MRNYLKTVGLTLLMAALAILIFVLIIDAAFKDIAEVSGEKVILLNHIVKTAEEHKDTLDVLDEIDADFMIVSTEDRLLYSHVEGGADPDALSVGQAIEKRYPYRYLIDDGKTWGTVILLDDPADGIKKAIDHVTLAMIILVLLIGAGMLLYGSYIRKNILIPFRNMKEFAAKVAQGKLDEPLEMDRDNMFGAFSESFDIMREELADARERELGLQKKERELVASLSHDLKTPVTGIKLTAELMQMRLSLNDPKDIDSLGEDAKGIYEKAEQIDELLADLFTSTLDDLGEFKVSCRDEESKILKDIIKSADDRALAVIDEIPAVVINIDKKRMARVIGNIISNSYKYANTRIDIRFEISDRYLEMLIEDHGPGVPASEIDLITNKFYRGRDWQDTDKDGNGLGLYIAKTLMIKMNGDLIAESDGAGLAITLVIPLS